MIDNSGKLWNDQQVFLYAFRKKDLTYSEMLEINRNGLAIIQLVLS